MDAIQIENPETLEKCKGLAFKAILRNSIEAQEVYIRRQYDCAGTDATAIAAIEVADCLAFNDLATGMREDFLSKTGRAV